MLETQACCLLTLQTVLILQGCCCSPSQLADSVLLVVWTWSADAILCLPTGLTVGGLQVPPRPACTVLSGNVRRGQGLIKLWESTSLLCHRLKSICSRHTLRSLYLQGV